MNLQTAFNTEYLLRVASICFALACCFSNVQAGSFWPFMAACVCAVVVLNCTCLGFRASPMRLNAQAMWLVGIVVLVASRSTRSDIVVAASDFLFGSGNFLSARQNDADILLDRRIRGCKRAINHPATFYSLGYVCTALLAGGFTSGHSNLYALVSMSVDIAMTLLSFFGLISGKFRDPAASFMALVVSSLFGILAALLAGNVWGILNKLFSGSGEFALACNAHAEYRQLAARDELEDISGGCFWENLVDHFFSATSACLTFPVSILYRTRPAPHTSL